MTHSRDNMKTLSDVLELVEAADLTSDQRKDMKSAINRVAEMAGVAPAMAEANAPALRIMLKRVRPAAHEVKTKTWANLVSQLRAALRLAGVIDPRRDGLALKEPAWASLLEFVANDKKLSCGLAAFANYCAARPSRRIRWTAPPSSNSTSGSRRGPCVQSRRMWCGVSPICGTRHRSGSRPGPRRRSPPSLSRLLSGTSAGLISPRACGPMPTPTSPCVPIPIPSTRGRTRQRSLLPRALCANRGNTFASRHRC